MLLCSRRRTKTFPLHPPICFMTNYDPIIVIFLDCTRKENHLKCFIILNSIISTSWSPDSRCSRCFLLGSSFATYQIITFLPLSSSKQAHKKALEKQQQKGENEHHLSSVFYLHYEEIMTRAAKKSLVMPRFLCRSQWTTCHHPNTQKTSQQMVLAARLEIIFL